MLAAGSLDRFSRALYALGRVLRDFSGVRQGTRLMAMNYRLLGPSGLRVSELCLGTMTFGDEAEEGWGASRSQARRIFDAFAEAGGNFFDTAVNYCGGESERYLGELIAS